MGVEKSEVKIVGMEEYIEKKTGNKEELAVIQVSGKNTDFRKVRFEHILQALGITGKQRTAFVFWLVNQANNNNQVFLTIRQMAEKSKISLYTVTTVMAQLTKRGAITKINIGAYVLNSCLTNHHGDSFDVLIRFMEPDKTERDALTENMI